MQMREYLNLTAKEFHLRTAHSKLVGFWTSEIGGLNQVVHIWEYGELTVVEFLPNILAIPVDIIIVDSFHVLYNDMYYVDQFTFPIH